MQPTTYADVNVILDGLLLSARRVLGEKLAGLYLYGSLVSGDFDPDISDIDLLAALTSDVDERDEASLRQMHAEFARCYPKWDDRIEVAYLSMPALKTFRTHSSKIAVISPGEPFHLKEAGRDWLANWYMVRERGMTLFGPPPATIIEPIDRAEFIQAIREYALLWPGWFAGMSRRRSAQAYSILTLCRALYTMTHGEQLSKAQAAAWAIAELPEWAPLIQRALVWRRAGLDEAGDVEDEAGFRDTERFVDFATRRIAAAPAV